MKHLIFYDANCRFCEASVNFIFVRDKKRCFYFAPLEGTTAKKYPEAAAYKNTLILLEDMSSSSPTILVRAKAAFRIFWLLGGCYKVLGALSFLPHFLINPFYRLFVFFLPRKKIFSPKQKSDQFLP